MRFFVIFCLIWLMFYISACSSSSYKAMPGPKLGELAVISSGKENLNTVKNQVIPVVGTTELLGRYRELLSTVDSPDLKRGIQMRLADLELRESEDLLVNGIPEEKPFSEAIELYETLLSQTESGSALDEERYEEQSEDLVRLQYQLSKAYSLAGQNKEAYEVLDRLANQQSIESNQLVIESYFRLAEKAFNQGDYSDAKEQYKKVIEQGYSNFEQNAHYMLGWSQFKLNKYDEALSSFIQVLDQILEVEIVQASDFQISGYDNLSASDKNLIEDSLRAMSIAFSYLGGAESIGELLSSAGYRSYSNLLFKELGTLYRSQERYKDAAETYLAYVEYEPFSPIAPEFSELAIQTYYEGNFPSLILPAKEAFVTSYGVKSLFWLSQSSEDLEALKPWLHEYLQELSSHYHATAQDIHESIGKQEQAKKKRVLLLAADYYDQFVLTFPQDSKTPELAFLRAEALFEANEYIKAVEAYELVAYTDLAGSEYANEAAYNLLLAIDQIMAVHNSNESMVRSVDQDTGPIAESAESDLWENRKLEASIRFASRYSEDVRAPVVLSQAMDVQFERKQYREVVAFANQLMSWQPAQSAELVQHAMLIAAKTEFIQEHYFAAEVLYQQLLETLDSGDSRIENILNQVATSIYRQAEVLLESGDQALAVNRFLAAAEFFPDYQFSSQSNSQFNSGTTVSEIVAVARFDAANNLMDMESWQASIEQFSLFLAQHPKHKLAREIPVKLAFIYQETGQWHLAADSLIAMLDTKAPDSTESAAENDKEIHSAAAEYKRETLFLAAQLYHQAGSTSDAKRIYQRYVDEYPVSDLLTMESLYQLVLLSSGSERNALVKKLTRTPEVQTDRTSYLNAWAANEQAELLFQRYNSKKISLPLKKSLKVKQQVLEEAINAYTQVLDYGVAEFTTLASYRIAEIYAGLSQSVLNSERPKNLDALALEQYEILLEEQAFPFEEKAIALHEANAQRSWEGKYDFWVQQSFESLGALLPGRYNKVESRVEVSHGIY